MPHLSDTMDKLDAASRTPADLARDLERDWLHVLKPRARALDDDDRTLLTLHHERSLSYEELARLTGRNRGTVYNRLRLLRARLRSPFAAVLLDETDPLPQRQRTIGVDHFLRGTSVRALADRYGVSLYHMRQQLQLIRGWVYQRYSLDRARTRAAARN